MELSGQRHAPAAIPGTHCRGGWVGLKAVLYTEARGKSIRLCRASNPLCIINYSYNLIPMTYVWNIYWNKYTKYLWLQTVKFSVIDFVAKVSNQSPSTKSPYRLSVSMDCIIYCNKCLNNLLNTKHRSDAQQTESFAYCSERSRTYSN
jgi:hypothetical protein